MKKITTSLLISIMVCAVYTSTVSGAGFFTDILNLESIRPDLTTSYLNPDKMKLKETWNKLNNDSSIPLHGVKVGIVDNRVEAGHLEFSGKNVNGNMIGKVDFGNTPKWVLSPLSALFPKDQRNHGMGVIGIIGANNISANSSDDYAFPHMNGVLSGIARIHYILEIRSPRTPITTFYQDLGRIDELAEENVSAINLSRGTGHLFGGLIMVKKKLQSHPDILFVAGAGNGNTDAESVSPANLGDELSNVITVGAVNNNDERAFFSNYGNSVNISAPGINLYTPAVRGLGNLPEGSTDYTFFHGTSASAPLVTGVAGLLKAIKPELTASDIKNILIRTADPIQTGETDKRLGKGCYTDPDDPINTGCRLNAYRAICDSQVGINCAQIGTVEGFVLKRFGRTPVPNRAVFLRNPFTFETITTATTDSTGFYRMTASPDTYLLSASTATSSGTSITLSSGITLVKEILVGTMGGGEF